MQTEFPDGELPFITSSEPDAEGIRKVIEYKLDDNGRKVKVIRRIRMKSIQTRVHKSVAQRMKWKKFGAASKDKPGPDPSTTSLGEEVSLRLHRGGISDALSAAEEERQRDPLSQLKDRKVMVCRMCKGDHWTLKCPYKDTLQPLVDLSLERKETVPTEGPISLAASDSSKTEKYVPPSLRGRLGGLETISSLLSMTPGAREDVPAVRVTNLSEDADENDLRDLFSNAGYVQKVFLPKDKVTGRPKGYAFIHFTTSEAAANAIKMFHGYGYESLILRVEWAK
jgi:translation initiation factor 3 subunit G